MIFSSSKTPGSVVAEIFMLKTTHKGGFLLVEGDDDSLFWSSRTSRAECQIVIAGGKPNVIGAAVSLDTHADGSVIGYYDCDFDRVAGRAVASPRLSLTDAHDLEIMMLSCSALPRVLAEIADPARLAALEKAEGRPILDCLVARSLPFGILRLLNQMRGFGVNFDGLSPYKYFSTGDWQPDIDALHADFALAAGVAPPALRQHLVELSVGQDLDMVQGHDTLNILAIGLRTVLGGRKSYSEREIASRLRSSVESTHLRKTALFQCLRAAEEARGLGLFDL